MSENITPVEIAEEPPAKLRAERGKPAGNVKTVVLCILFGLLAFVFAMSAAGLLTFRTALETTVVSSSVADVDPSDIKVGMLLKADALEDVRKSLYIPENKIDDDSTLAECIAATASQYENVSVSDIEELLAESGIMSEIGATVAAYERYLLTGKDEETFSQKKLLATIKKLRPDIKKYTGVDIAKYYDEIEKTFKNNSKYIREMNPSEAMKGAGQFTSVMLSLPAIIVAGSLSLVMLVIALVITKRPIACARTLGIVCTVAGAIFLAATLFCLQILQSTIPTAASYLAKLLNASVAPITRKCGAVFLAVGISIIVISGITSLIVKKIRRARASQTGSAVLQ